MIEKAPYDISECAAILDKEFPGWANKIDVKKLDMSTFDMCILGQLYGDYGDGKDTLFESGGGGGFANETGEGLEKWKAEIKNRIVKNNSFIWAMEQIQQGAKVRRKDWLNDYHINSKKGMICYQDNKGSYVLHIGDYLANDWELYKEKVTLRSIPCGKNFRFINDKKHCPNLLYRKYDLHQIVQLKNIEGEDCCKIIPTTTNLVEEEVELI